MKTVVFIRKKRADANSIEEIFKLLLPHLGENVELKELPCSNASPISILKNLIYAYKNRGDVNHISGEIHYIALVLGRRTLLTIHDVRSILRGNRITRFLKKILWFSLPCRIVHKISTISHFSLNEILEVAPYVKNKISVVYNPYNTQLLQHIKPNGNNNRKIRILHVGTKPNKNLELVLKALEGFKGSLYVLGKMTDSQIRKANEIGIEYKNIYDIPFSQVAELYNDVDIISFPSKYEGFGMPVIEANVVGRPIIAGNIPVLHEIGADSAYYVNTDDIDEYRVAVKMLSEDDSLKECLCKNGKNNVLRFTPQVIALNYMKLYKELRDL